MLDPVVASVLRIGLALVFAAAFLHKARDVRGFAATLADYRLLPSAWAPGLVPVFLAAEAVTAGLLLAPLPGAPGGLAALGLLATYTAAIAINLARGRRDIDCGCLGPWARQPLSYGLLVRNGLLVAAALGVLVPTGARALHWVDGITVLMACAALALLWEAANRLASLPRSSP